ncbi:MAG: hypothetical protein ACFWTZ_02130 [Burkholderia sp.]|jgi:hypothetical protein
MKRRAAAAFCALALSALPVPALSAVITVPAAAAPSAPQPALAQTGAAKLLEQVRQKYAPDPRTALFDVKLVTTPSGGLRLEGKTGVIGAAAELHAGIFTLGGNIAEAIKVLPSRDDLKDKIFAVVTVPEARALNKPSGETTETLTLGTPMALYEIEGDFLHVMLPDGTLAWVSKSQARQISETEVLVWNRHDKLCAKKDGTAFKTADGKTMTLPALALLRRGADLENGRVEAWLPFGPKGTVNAADFVSQEAFQKHEEMNRRERPERYLSFVAKTAGELVSGGAKFASGHELVRRAFALHDLIVRRDADMMLEAFGKKNAVPLSEVRAGDVLFVKDKDGRLDTALAADRGKAFFGGQKARPIKAAPGKIIGAVRFNTGDLADPCLVSTRSNGLYQTPAVMPRPCPAPKI